MICKFFQTLRIKPIEPFLKADNHFNITIKDEKNIHLLHINSNKKNILNLNVKSLYDVATEQPKKIHNADVNDKDIDLKQSLPKIILKEESDTRLEISDQKICSKKNDLTENFTNLIESSKFKKKPNFGLKYLESDDPLINCSIIFKNKIKLETSKSASNLNENKDEKLNRPLLFFIHGVGGNSKIWSKQIEFFLTKGYEIIAIDLLGHGQSSAPIEPNCYEFLEMALDVLLIFDMFSKNDNIVIGHSYGCSFSTYLAQNRPDVISKLVLISGGSPHPLDFKNPLLDSPLWFIKLIYPILNCHFYCSAFSSFFNRPRNSKEAFNLSPRVLLYTMKGQIWHSATEEFHRRLKQPILLIEGEKDLLVPIDDALDMVNIVKYGYLVVIKNGSHMVIMENFDIVNKLVNLFLQDDFL